MTKVNSLERDIINYGVVLNYPKGAYIFDFRDLMLSCPRALEFGNALYEKIQDYKFDYVVCYGIGGLVTCNMLRAAALHRGYNLRMLYVRDQRKTYALKKLIEGDEIIQNPRVVLIDDAISTGTSIDKCLEALAEYSPVLVARVIILDNGAAGTRGMRLRGETVHTLFHRRDIGMSREKPPHTACHVVWIDVDVHVKDQDAMRAKPVYDKVNDLLYVGTDQFKLICYQASLGKRLWETHVGNANYKGIASTPAYKNGLIYFGAYDGVARCVDTEGKTIWNSLIGEAIHGSPFLDDNFSYWSVETWKRNTSCRKARRKDPGRGRINQPQISSSRAPPGKRSSGTWR
jgi:orotate phosphoribosyltransferase